MTARIEKYTPQDQEDLLRTKWIAASNRLSALLVNKRDEIIKLAHYRGMNLGIQEYGDKAFFKTREQLSYETMCELADAIFYQAIYDIKERQIIP